MPDTRFAGKVALVTGGTSGIGRAVAHGFAREGAAVVIAGRRVERGEAVRRELEEMGAPALFVAADVSRAPDVESLVARTLERFERIDCASNNAGALEMGVFKPTADFDEAEFDGHLALNLKSVWLCMKHEIHVMLAQFPAGGAIVNTSSVNGLGGAPGGALYSAAKAGVLALTKSAAQEYATQGIRVNALVAGAFLTPMLQSAFEHHGGGTPEGAAAVQAKYEEYVALRRIGRPEEAASTVVWLCSDAASYVTGHSMIVDGGMTAPFR